MRGSSAWFDFQKVLFHSFVKVSLTVLKLVFYNTLYGTVKMFWDRSKYIDNVEGRWNLLPHIMACTLAICVKPFSGCDRS
jgi:hypothetical protein